MRQSDSRQRHFRAIFLWSLGGIALLQLGLGSLIDIALPEVRDPEYAHREDLLQKRLLENDGKPVVVVLGSSRVQNGLDAQTATQTLDGAALVFNFGIPHAGPFLERVWKERLHDRGLKPDVLLIEVLPAHYNARRPYLDLRELNGARLNAHELTEMPRTLDTLAGPARRWLIGRTLPGLQHQAELRARLGLDDARQGVFTHPDLRMIDRLGWQPRTFPPEECAVLKMLAHRQYDSAYRDFELSSEQVRLLEENLQHCRQEGIRAALLLMPEGSEFRNLCSPAMSPAIDGMLADLKQRFGVPIIDARAWMADDRFFDMHHLRPDGASVFSERLAREALGPLLSTRALAKRGN